MVAFMIELRNYQRQVFTYAVLAENFYILVIRLNAPRAERIYYRDFSLRHAAFFVDDSQHKFQVVFSFAGADYPF